MLQSIGRTMHASRSGEAGAQRRQTWLPWIWLATGLVVVTIFSSWLMSGNAPKAYAVQRQSAILSTPVQQSRL
jgi:hypothetical protein